MNTPFFIAKRYLLARKSHNLINIITWISIVGISVASFAMIVVLSAFNGIEDVVSDLNSRLSPDLQITPEKGKTLSLAAFPIESLKTIGGVNYVVPTLTEDALFRANEKQHIGQVKGVGPEYAKVQAVRETLTGTDSLCLSDGSHAFAVPGAGVAWYLGVNTYNPYSVLRIYVPRRGNASSFNVENSFNSGALTIQSVFSTNQESDEKLVLVPFQWLSDLLEYDGQKATAVELFLDAKTDVNKIKRHVVAMLGDGFTVKDRREQHETLYKIMHTEKWAVYAILTFILVLATFNVIGSLSMLMIDKRKDVDVLNALGGNRRFIRRLFMSEGLLISVAGGCIGLVLGIVLVWLQQRFGFVKLGQGGNYVIESYPVLLKFTDAVTILATILVLGCTSAFVTVQQAMKRMNTVSLRS